MAIIIDRRLNDRNKNAVNRQRFIRRHMEQLKQSIAKEVAKRSLTDVTAKGGTVSIPIKDIHEPTFHHGSGGDREYVHTGNKKFQAGDKIPRPQGGAGSGAGDGEGESADDFKFVLSREEFMRLFFDDLELPHLVRSALADAEHERWRRAGYTPSGVPANLSIPRSLRNALARRIALRAPLRRQLVALTERQAPQGELDALEQRIARIPFLDEIDLRYRHRVRDPQPVAKAVMFCLMDVSASMTEEKKDLAKRFFYLLYLFLTRKYQHVKLRFIRHTDTAQEVDENTFFHDTQSGGTIVLPALKLASKIIKDDGYGGKDWNVYGAQCSDGDAFKEDPAQSAAWLTTELLPLMQYFAYVELPDTPGAPQTLMRYYNKDVRSDHFATKSVSAQNEVYPVLRELFRKEAGVH